MEQPFGEKTQIRSVVSPSAGPSDLGGDVILVDVATLSSPQVRPSLWRYLKSNWDRRNFIWMEARSKAFATGNNTFLGKAWIFLDPLLQVAIYALIFGVVLRTSRGIDNFIGFLIIGVTFFRFMSKGFDLGTGLISSSRSMISSFNFPKSSLVVSAVVRALIDNVAPAVLAVVMALAFQWGQPISWTLILVLPLYLLMHLFILGLALFLARLTAFVPDVRSLVPVITRMLFFVSGVFYSLERFDSHPMIHDVMVLNPIYCYLKSFRNVIIYSTVPSLSDWLFMGGSAVVLVLVGLIYFWGAEERYANIK